MTCIVGIVDKTSVMIAGDTAASDGWNVYHRTDTKTFHLKNKDFDMVFGYTTSFRMGQLIRYKLKLPRNERDDLFQYMVLDFVEALRTVLKDGGFASKEKEVERGGTFLIGVEGRLFGIGGDYQVAENSNGVMAVGSGEEYALGSLHATESTKLSTKDRATKALDAASFYSAFVAPPYTYDTVPIPKVKK